MGLTDLKCSSTSCMLYYCCYRNLFDLTDHSCYGLHTVKPTDEQMQQMNTTNWKSQNNEILPKIITPSLLTSKITEVCKMTDEDVNFFWERWSVTWMWISTNRLESLPHRRKVSNMDEKVSTGQKIEESKQVFFLKKQKTRNIRNKRLN